jgi:hypothetical protein
MSGAKNVASPTGGLPRLRIGIEVNTDQLLAYTIGRGKRLEVHL